MNADFKARVLLRFFLLLFLLTSGLVQAQDTAVPASPEEAAYRLAAGDRIHITVHNQDDLSGEFVLNGSGSFSMPLIGTVVANGLTAAGLEEMLVYRLKPDYLVNPRVAVRIQNYRPYYIIGEVESTGRYDYVQGMSYLTAIAIAGGYTYRGKRDVVYVIRGTDLDREEMKLDVDEKVLPGDIIRVAERLF